MSIGKRIRLTRLTRNDRILCVPLDHGVTYGPMEGLTDVLQIISNVKRGGATAIVVHKGIIRSFKCPPKLGIIMHVSASTDLSLAPDHKALIGTVEEAIRLGADAISVHINIGSRGENEMLAGLGKLAGHCDEMGLPLLAMMYARGEHIKNPCDPEIVAHLARIGAELGADIVKTTYTGDPTSFKRVVQSCPVPIVIAGGPKCQSEKDVLTMAAGAMKAGAIGVSFGRNVFQHENPEAMVKALSQVVLKNCPVRDALEIFGT